MDLPRPFTIREASHRIHNPLPERLIGAAPEAVIGNALGPEWGSAAETFGDEVRAAYTAALSDAEHIHAICEEYRAAAGIDRARRRPGRGPPHRLPRTRPVERVRAAPRPGNRGRQRSGLKAARTSVANSSGSSQAAKWPPRSASWK
jgi:hypothetical protein